MVIAIDYEMANTFGFFNRKSRSLSGTLGARKPKGRHGIYTSMCNCFFLTRRGWGGEGQGEMVAVK